jgi:hypothetical protein
LIAVSSFILIGSSAKLPWLIVPLLIVWTEANENVWDMLSVILIHDSLATTNQPDTNHRNGGGTDMWMLSNRAEQGP